MTTIIDKPNTISQHHFNQLLELIEKGSQVDMEGLDERILTADLIAILLDDDKIISTATLKNPFVSYRNRVFTEAGVDADKELFSKELGYIVTDPDYEGQKLCQNLLSEFIPVINKQRIFATTRKPSMAHILTKFGFEKYGNTYKKDLNLLINNGKK